MGKNNCGNGGAWGYIDSSRYSRANKRPWTTPRRLPPVSRNCVTFRGSCPRRDHEGGEEKKNTWERIAAFYLFHVNPSVLVFGHFDRVLFIDQIDRFPASFLPPPTPSEAVSRTDIVARRKRDPPGKERRGRALIWIKRFGSNTAKLCPLGDTRGMHARNSPVNRADVVLAAAFLAPL